MICARSTSIAAIPASDEQDTTVSITTPRANIGFAERTMVARKAVSFCSAQEAGQGKAKRLDESA
eukprot:6184167-Alexandrium_andersonii.AAC.1